MHGQKPEVVTTPFAGVPVRIGRILSDTGKTVTAQGELDGQRVVIKALASADPAWHARLLNEIAVYQRFAATPPPIRVPRLAGTDGGTWLALEYLPGLPLGTSRHLTSEPGPGQLTAVLSAVRALNDWDPPASAFAHVPDYQERIDRYHAAGTLTGSDRAALATLLGRCGDRREFCHGDLIPANIWLLAGDGAGDGPGGAARNGPGGGSCALLDWEFAGWYLPGYDLAMLAVLSGSAAPGLRRTIGDLVSADGTAAAFCVNLAAVLTRELRLHRELDEADPGRAPLAAIEDSWACARRLIHREAARRPLAPSSSSREPARARRR